MIYKYQILLNNTTNTACSFGNCTHFRHPTDEQLRRVDIYFLVTKMICSLSTLNWNAMFNRFWNIFSLLMVYKEHLAPFQLSSVLIFLTLFTKVGGSSNVNPNISRNIVTSRYDSTFSKSPALGSRARTSALHFSGFKVILFSRNHFHTSLCFFLRFAWTAWAVLLPDSWVLFG